MPLKNKFNIHNDKWMLGDKQDPREQNSTFKITYIYVIFSRVS